MRSSVDFCFFFAKGLVGDYAQRLAVRAVCTTSSPARSCYLLCFVLPLNPVS